VHLDQTIQIHDKYLKPFLNDSRYFIVTGGRGSSKSFSICFIVLALISEETGHSVLFTRYTLRSASISIIPEFIEKIELANMIDQFYVTRDEIIHKKTGSKIIFRGLKTSSGDQTASLKSLTGISTWVMDEAEELNSEDVFDKIDLSVREQGVLNRVIMILNPTTKEHWIYTRFFESKGVEGGFNGSKDDTTYIHTTYLDNIKNLSESFLQRIEQMKLRRPERYKHQVLGGWQAKAEGVIFENWKLGDFKEVGKIVAGADFGFSTDPSTLILTSIDKDNKIIYLKECFYLKGLTTSELSDLYQKHAKDNLIIADSASPRLIHELALKSNVKASIKGQGSVIYGISLMLDYDLIVDPESKNLIKELNNYRWLEKKSQTPISDFDHCIDAIRYSVAYQLANPYAGQYHII
tara:strand:+ start:6442 stop:7665 length:1224 start_codon:yes stop_codon:yes gene_type:complete